MSILLVLFAYAYSATKECTSHNSKYYLSHCCPINKANFFYPNTMSNAQDRCVEYTNQQLRQEYKSWIRSTDQVEHIIDSNNGPSELSNCNKNIRGNLIIAIGAWNQGVGNMCWKDVNEEKRKVYGNNIVDYAYESVRICCNPNEGLPLFMIVGVVSIICIALLIIHLEMYRRYPEYKDKCDELYFKMKQVSVKQEQEYELVNVEPDKQ